MKTSKTFKVIMLPTEKASPLFSYKERPDLLYYQSLREWTSIVNHFHLYIIPDEKIKEGDWYYDTRINKVQKWNLKNHDAHIEKKIVATTDKSLKIGECNGCFGTRYNPEHILDGYHYYAGQKSIKCTSISLPQLPESFIQAYIKAYNEGKPITEVDLEGQYLKDGSFHVHTRMDNTVIVHQSKMYSRDEVSLLIQKYYSHAIHHGIKESSLQADVDKWIQDNLS